MNALVERLLSRSQAHPTRVAEQSGRDARSDGRGTQTGRRNPISHRRRVEVQGIVHAVFHRPTAGGGTELVARISTVDGGSVELVWLGRKHIAGVQPGAQLRAEGLLTTLRGRRTIFNPTYELRPSPVDAV